MAQAVLAQAFVRISLTHKASNISKDG